MYETRYTSRHAVCTLGKFVPPCIGLTLNSCNGLLENVHLCVLFGARLIACYFGPARVITLSNPKNKEKVESKKKNKKSFSPFCY